MNDSVQLIKFNYFFTIFDSYCIKNYYAKNLQPLQPYS